MGFYRVTFTCKATQPGRTYDHTFRAVRAGTRQEAVEACEAQIGPYVSVRVEMDDYFAENCVSGYSNPVTHWTGD